MNKHYNLTEKYGEKVQDKSPEWMDKFFEKHKDGVKKDKRDIKQLKDVKSIYDL